MGDYDFLSGLDLGNIAPGTGMLSPESIPSLPDFTIPDFPAFGGGAGIMGGVNIPDVNIPSFGGGYSLGGGGALSGGMATTGGDMRSTIPTLPGQPLGTMQLDGDLPPSGGGGFNLASILKPAQGVLQGVTGAAGLGLQGLGIKASLDAAKNAREQAGIQRGFQQNQQQLQQQQQKSVQPLQQFGTNQLQQASAGQVDPAIQAYIDQWAQAEKVKMQQQFARMGITNSSMMQSALGAIDKQALAMKSSVIGQDKGTAIQALQAAMSGTGTAMQGANQGAQVANQEQNQLDNLIRSSQQALAQLNAMAA